MIGGNPSAFSFGQKSLGLDFTERMDLNKANVHRWLRERKCNEHPFFYKPQKPLGVCCVPHSGLCLDCFPKPVKTGIFQEKCVKHRAFKGPAVLLRN